MNKHDPPQVIPPQGDDGEAAIGLIMNSTPQADLDALYDLLPIMWGEQPAACRKLGISRPTLRRRLKLLEVRGLAVSIGTGWLPTSDSWIQEALDE